MVAAKRMDKDSAVSCERQSEPESRTAEARTKEDKVNSDAEERGSVKGKKTPCGEGERAQIRRRRPTNVSRLGRERTSSSGALSDYFKRKRE